MPSPFEAFKRIIQGKPVYDVNENPVDPTTGVAPADHATETQTTIQKNSDTTFPVVEVRRTDSRPNGQMLQIYCSIRNSWNGPLDIDSIRLLDNETKLHLSLGPGQEKEVLVYNGPVLTNTRGSEALILYKTETGDYFEAIHEIHYAYTAQQTYEVTGLSLHLPIRDVYG
jgi:hypothetical protein